jgi:hypothetical protein
MLQVAWIKCGETGNSWWSLSTVDLSNSHFNNLEGVYVIWHGGDKPRYVKVGQGIIKNRLAAHRTDPEIQTYANLGLYVTWAQVSTDDRDGVEAYLATRLNPLVGDRFPGSVQIAVNLPSD